MRTSRALLGAAFAVAFFAAACGGGAPPPAEPPTAPVPEEAATALAPGDTFSCPMHPDVKAGAPAKCPACGMDLVEAAPDTAAAATETPVSGTAVAETPAAPAAGDGGGHGTH